MAHYSPAPDPHHQPVSCSLCGSAGSPGARWHQGYQYLPPCQNDLGSTSTNWAVDSAHHRSCSCCLPLTKQGDVFHKISEHDRVSGLPATSISTLQETDQRRKKGIGHLRKVRLTVRPWDYTAQRTAHLVTSSELHFREIGFSEPTYHKIFLFISTFVSLLQESKNTERFNFLELSQHYPSGETHEANRASAIFTKICMPLLFLQPQLCFPMAHYTFKRPVPLAQLTGLLLQTLPTGHTPDIHVLKTWISETTVLFINKRNPNQVIHTLLWFNAWTSPQAFPP